MEIREAKNEWERRFGPEYVVNSQDEGAVKLSRGVQTNNEVQYSPTDTNAYWIAIDPGYGEDQVNTCLSEEAMLELFAAFLAVRETYNEGK